MREARRDAKAARRMWATTSLIALALALAADAFAVALCQGAAPGAGMSRALRVGTAFGAAQATMPMIGWIAGLGFLAIMRSLDHWIVLFLLGFLGLRMIREAAGCDPETPRGALAGWALAGAAVATSLDALAAGVTLPTLELPVLLACAVIGAATFLLCTGGVLAGRIASRHVGKYAELAGGLVLIGLGLKIFVEHQFLGA